MEQQQENRFETDKQENYWEGVALNFGDMGSKWDLMCLSDITLRKHAYSNILKILQPNFTAVLTSTHNLCFFWAKYEK